MTKGNSTWCQPHAYLYCVKDVIVIGGENKSLPGSVRPFLRNWVILHICAFQNDRRKHMALLEQKVLFTIPIAL